MSGPTEKPSQQSSLLAFFAPIGSNTSEGGIDDGEQPIRKRRRLPVASEPPAPTHPAPQDKRYKLGRARYGLALILLKRG